ncbi:hypothetical protein AKJ66_03300 [candidate division MSBL1 archaeon SCGC-AAA259E22]|uniref:YutG/PgpA domain-containing protein n=1 Tax=candidate division MSBL1 archaeon SCGC-AAA259E22 TaxID=1698265 RepID=A0A133UF84_9EURY|nr:hypothetical protein AKJ66_03300 [candidate division MSBL1 archaeon SCGC-AAA259E22]
MIGELIGRATRRAVREGLKDCGITPSRSLEERLEERGISFDDLLDTAEEAFVFHPDSSSEEGTVDLLREELKKWMKDVNVGSLVIGGLHLNEVGDQGNLPELPAKDFESDPVHLISDEILGMRIANYINGEKGVFEFERVDRSKPGILKELGPFTDDVVGGLIAGACSRVYER